MLPLLLLLACILYAVHAQLTFPLSDVSWTISSPALNRTVPGHLPSHVHLDLLKAGVIGKCLGRSILVKHEANTPDR